MKKALSIFGAILLLISLSACGNSKPDKSDNMSNEKYIEILLKLNDEIYQQSVLLSNIGDYINSYWKALDNFGGTLNSEKAIKNGYKWLSEKSEYTEQDILDNDSNIIKLYKEMLQANNSDASLADVSSRLKEQYTDYKSLYSIVTSPSGARGDFVDVFNDVTNKISSTYETVKGLLEQ